LLEAASTPDDIENLLKAVTDPKADLWALTGEGSERYGGSGKVGGGGDDNDPPPDTRGEHGSVPASPQFEGQTPAPSDVPEGGVKPISQENMPPVVGPSTVEPELAGGALPPEELSKLGYSNAEIAQRNYAGNYKLGSDVKKNGNGTVTVRFGGVPLGLANKRGESYSDVLGSSGAIYKLMNGEATKKFDEKIKPLDKKRRTSVKAYEKAVSDIKHYTEIIENHSGPRNNAFVNAERQKRRLSGELPDIIREGDELTAELKRLNDGRAEAYKLQQSYSGKRDKDGKAAVKSDVIMDYEKALRLGIIK